MLKKLTKAQQDSILEHAIEEFGDKGLAKTTVSSIAAASGVSVGVIYKYYKNKEDLFQACLNYSMEMLGRVLEEAIRDSASFREAVERLVHVCRIFPESHKGYIRMYHAITMKSAADHAVDFAKKIETISARTYETMFSKAKAAGELSAEIDSHAFAFFFDNLLMMFHFSFGCDYYEERLRIFLNCGDGAPPDGDGLEHALVTFLCAAAGIRS